MAHFQRFEDCQDELLELLIEHCHLKNVKCWKRGIENAQKAWSNLSSGSVWRIPVFCLSVDCDVIVWLGEVSSINDCLHILKSLLLFKIVSCKLRSILKKVGQDSKSKNVGWQILQSHSLVYLVSGNIDPVLSCFWGSGLLVHFSFLHKLSLDPLLKLLLHQLLVTWWLNVEGCLSGWTLGGKNLLWATFHHLFLFIEKEFLKLKLCLFLDHSFQLLVLSWPLLSYGYIGHVRLAGHHLAERFHWLGFSRDFLSTIYFFLWTGWEIVDLGSWHFDLARSDSECLGISTWWHARYCRFSLILCSSLWCVYGLLFSQSLSLSLCLCFYHQGLLILSLGFGSTSWVLCCSCSYFVDSFLVWIVSLRWLWWNWYSWCIALENLFFLNLISCKFLCCFYIDSTNSVTSNLLSSELLFMDFNIYWGNSNSSIDCHSSHSLSARLLLKNSIFWRKNILSLLFLLKFTHQRSFLNWSLSRWGSDFDLASPHWFELGLARWSGSCSIFILLLQLHFLL